MLEEHPHVLRVANKPHYLKVHFDTGISEYWALSTEGLKKSRSYELPLDEDLFTDHIIPIYKQFETNRLLFPEDYEILKNHFIIKKSDLDQAGWCEVRFKVHDLAVELAEEGYVPIRYTRKILDEDLERLKNEDLSRYQTGITRFSAFSSRPPSGRRLIMHFMPCHARNKWEFYPIYQTINKLLHRDFTREDIVYYMSRDYHISRHPAFYRALFNQWFDIAGKRVLDMDPNWGFKALAVLIEDGEYHCDSPNLQHLIEMGNYVGGSVSGPDGGYYDLVIISDAVPVEMSDVPVLLEKYHGVGEYLMLSVRIETTDDWTNLYETFKPVRALRINNSVVNNVRNDNMLMIVRG